MKATATCERLVMDSAAKFFTIECVNFAFTLVNSNIGNEFSGDLIPMLVEISFFEKSVEKKIRFELEQSNAVGEQKDFVSFLTESDAKQWWNFFPMRGAVSALSVTIWVGDDFKKAPIPGLTTALCNWYAYPV